MSDNAPDKWVAFRFVALILGVTVLVMGATLGVGMLVTTAPRGIMFWYGWGFAMFVEFLIGMFTANLFARQRSRYRPSGATMMMVYIVIAIYAVLGMASILVYVGLRDENGASDPIFFAVMIVVSLIAVVLVAVVYGYELFFQGKMAPVLEKRREHAGKALDLGIVLSTLQSGRAPTDELITRRGRVAKRLEAVQTALAHSHGGGVGSYEGGRGHELDPAAERELASAAAQIEELAHSLPAEADGYAEGLAQLERLTTKMENAVTRLGM